MCVLTYSLLFGISMSGNFSLQPDFFPLVIDKWCFETAGGKAVISQGLSIKINLLLGLQHASFYLVLALLLLWKK